MVQVFRQRGTGAGMIEYWTGSDYTFPKAQVAFSMKLDTDLFALAKAKTTSKSLEVSKDGSQFAIFCADRWALLLFLCQTPCALSSKCGCMCHVLAIVQMHRCRA